jgi:hypothetical protein
MLRLLVLLLVLANAAFFAWSVGWLDDVTGVRAIGDREPERLARQVHPESIRILPPGGPAASGATAASSSVGARVATTVADAATTPACLETGPLNPTQFATVEALLQMGLPSGSWTHLKSERPALWMVYMGKFNDAETMTKRQDELRRLKVEYEILRTPSDLAPGLSLGRFEIRSNANNLLEQLTLGGVRNARVIEAVPASATHVLRVDKPTATIAAQLAALRADALGKGFVPCAKP